MLTEAKEVFDLIVMTVIFYFTFQRPFSRAVGFGQHWIYVSRSVLFFAIETFQADDTFVLFQIARTQLIYEFIATIGAFFEEFKPTKKHPNLWVGGFRSSGPCCFLFTEKADRRHRSPI
ncbi:hypothetical protein SLA2020_452850 [Shorea laevis]